MNNFYKKSQFGRSMVEMLGVLAIIGVLSVAGIAGYSAAMGKYQINKYRESLNLFLNEAVKLLPELERQYGKGTTSGVTLNSLFADSSMLPDGMNYDKSNDEIYDIFKNKNTIRYRVYDDGKVRLSQYLVTIDMQRSEERIAPRDQEICRNVFMVAQQNSENIYAITMYVVAGGGDGGNTSSGFSGDLNRGGDPLRKATLSDFDRVCKVCKSPTHCFMVIYFSSKS